MHLVSLVVLHHGVVRGAVQSQLSELDGQIDAVVNAVSVNDAGVVRESLLYQREQILGRFLQRTGFLLNLEN